MAKRPKFKFEGSPKDRRQDKAGAKRLGVSQKAYERTPQDRAEDRAGQAALPMTGGPSLGMGMGGYSKGGKVRRRR